MKHLIPICLICFLIVPLQAQTNISGSISKDSTWSIAGSPYIVIASFTVNPRFTLKVDSAVVVRFQSGTIMYVSGTLRARHATFTSNKDTTRGNPQKGDWASIYPNSSSAVLILDTCQVKFGGSNSTPMINGSSLLSATLTKCSFVNSDNVAVYLNASSSITMTNCLVSNSGSGGVSLVSPTVNMTGCNISSSGGTGVFVNGGTDVVLTGCTVTGSTNNGQGLWIGSTNSTMNNCTITGSSSHGIFIDHGSTATLTNTSVSSSGDQGMYLGYNSKITAYLDSCTVSGSTNTGVRVNGTDTLFGCTVTNSNGGSAVYVYSGSLALIGCSIANSPAGGVYFEQGTSVAVTNSSISSTQWPLWYRGTASLVFNGSNTLTGNTHNGIYMEFSSTNANIVLDTTALPYVFPYDFTVSSGNTMTIASTAVLKFNGGHLNVSGTLKAIASAGQYIYLTSYKNDNLPIPGSDTNNDGTATAPAAQDWGGVVFGDGSVDTACVMRRCKISFAGSGRTGGISMYNASPTIDSCDMSNNYFGAMMQDVSNPVFSNNVIGSSQVVPIAMSFTANPFFVNNTLSFSDNRYDAIGLLGSSTPANGVLRIRSVTSIPNITYLLLQDITVPAQSTFTINKGIVIKGLYDYPYVYSPPRIIVQGKMVAVGTPDSMITFTSARDDNSGNPGDSNKDGTGSAPQRGDWGGITFEGTSDTSSVLNYCRIKYGSMPGIYYNTRYISGGGITTVNASPTISNCTIDNTVFGVYAFQSSKLKIWNDTLRNTQYTPIAMSVSADPSIIGNVFVNTTWTAIGIIGENLGLSGSIKQRTVAGIANITYVVLEDLTINSGTYVTVDPGVVVKLNNSGIFVNGGFQAKGSIAAPIVFTSLKDDNYGNPQDSNGDGSATSPAQGDWHTIRFLGTSDDAFCVMESCVIKFGGASDDRTWGNVSYADASGTLSHSTVTDSYQYGISCNGNSVPHIDNVDIRSCKLDPIAMSLKADPVLTNITFAANGSKGIKILEGTISSDAVLHQRNVAGITNVAYIVDYLTISSNAVLTIDPGVVIKFPYIWYSRCNIVVQGGLRAAGTASQRIIFTSIMDDSNGGDTNNDGNTTTPARGDWWQILFTQTSNGAMNVLKNCDVRYGGYPGSDDQWMKDWGVVDIQSAHVLIDSCAIQQSLTSGIGIYGSADPLVQNSEFTNIAQQPVTRACFRIPCSRIILLSMSGIWRSGSFPKSIL
jgi:parallel beta-helix repeat protein